MRKMGTKKKLKKNGRLPFFFFNLKKMGTFFYGAFFCPFFWGGEVHFFFSPHFWVVSKLNYSPIFCSFVFLVPTTIFFFRKKSGFLIFLANAHFFPFFFLAHLPHWPIIYQLNFLFMKSEFSTITIQL